MYMLAFRRGVSGGGGLCTSLACQAWRTSLARVSAPRYSSLPLRSSSVSETSLSHSSCLPPSQSSVHFTLFLATLPSPGPLENVIRDQPVVVGVQAPWVSRACGSVIFCPVPLLSDQLRTARLTSGALLPLFDFQCHVCLHVRRFLICWLCVTTQTFTR